MPYYNYLGVLMPEGGAESNDHLLGTSAGNETLTAPAGNASLSGEGGGDKLIGSSGDNHFFITNPKDIVVEQANGGIDTEIGWTSIKLAANVENLTVHGDFNYAVGNDLANLIVVDGSQWVVGGRGNDVLVGSTTQKTSFAFQAGDGNDVVYNWNGNSQLQLTGYGLDSASQIRGAMTQQGSDVLLRLSSSESITFRGTTIGAFTDRQLLTALDQSKLGAMTFDDEFNSLQIYNPSTGTGQWQTNFGGNLKDQWAYTLVSNGETQAYVAPGFQGRGEQDIGVNPFSVSNGVLTITAAPVSSEDAYSTWNRDYTSGMINTYGSFAQKYGYFEMRAELPTAVGSWPAFWMLPHPYQANAEADIMEALAATPNVDYRHAAGGANGSEGLYDNVYKADATGFHTYGMLWTADKLTFYYDGVAVMTGATPSTWTSPMAMIVNLATGGWGGATNGAQFPAQLNIDYVRAYALADGSSTVVASTPERPVDTLIDEGPASGRTPVTETFSDGTPVSSAHIAISGSHPTTLPPGKTFMIWEDSGAVFGAVSDGSTLAAPTVLMAGTASQFTGSGTWLTTGKLVFSYYMPNATGGHDLWDMVFDPAKKTFVRQDLGPAAADAHATFVATEVGGFAVSWHAPDGTVVARGYDEWAYGGDIPGWYGPTRQITGDLIGVASQGKVIAANGAGQEIYSLYQASAQQAPGVGFGSGAVTHAEGNTGTVAFDYVISRSGPTDAAGSVVWTVTGTGAHPADAADFENGAMPQGVVNFAAGEVTKTITVRVVGDATTESDETFTVSLSNPVGGTITTATANGTITNDDGATGGSTGGGSTGGGSAGGQVLTSSGPGATLIGGAGNDTLNASQGEDHLTGGAGADTFAFANTNWAPAHITDFTVGTDRLDLSGMFQKAGITASDPVASHYVSFLDDGAGGTKVLFDSDAGGNNPQWPSYVIQLEHVSSVGLTWSALTGGSATGGGSTGGGATTPPPSGSGAFIVFAGQSNMGAPYQDASTVTSRWSPDPLTQIWNDAAGRWEQMNPGVNTGYGGATSGWGPEVEFAIDFRASHPGETLRIVKSVFGGTILQQDTVANHADWSPQSSGELFDQTTAVIGRASAAAGGLTPTLAFWGQGEEDANYSASASAYGSNLSALFTAIRSTWLHDANGKIGYFQIGTSPPYSAQVRAGEQSVDQADPNATSFDSAGYALQADGLHFAASGLKWDPLESTCRHASLSIL